MISTHFPDEPLLLWRLFHSFAKFFTQLPARLLRLLTGWATAVYDLTHLFKKTAREKLKAFPASAASAVRKEEDSGFSLYRFACPVPEPKIVKKCLDRAGDIRIIVGGAEANPVGGEKFIERDTPFVCVDHLNLRTALPRSFCKGFRKGLGVTKLLTVVYNKNFSHNHFLLKYR